MAISIENVNYYFWRTPSFNRLWNHWPDEQKALFIRLANAVHHQGFDWYPTRGDLRIGRKNIGPDDGNNVAVCYLRRTGLLLKFQRSLGNEALNSQHCLLFEAPNYIPPFGFILYFQARGPEAGNWPRDYENIPPSENMTLPINTILYGPPGTGKTFSTTALALSVLADFEDAGAYAATVQDGAYAAAPGTVRWREWVERFEDLRKAGRVEVTTFHQNYSYEDFVEGLRAKVVTNKDENTRGETTSVAYDIEPGIFKRIAYRAMYAWLTGTAPEAGDRSEAEVIEVVDAWLGDGKEPDQKRAAGAEAPPYVLIIDEINRGNMSRILGELITLLEDSKRAKLEDEIESGDQPMAATLAYTKLPFMVPPNLYIIGTMNTADRSLVGLDLALRRRFSFIELEPHPEALCNAISDAPALNLQSFLGTLNARIETELDRDHKIGHAFLCGVSDIAGLQQAMRDKVIPQLIEYFHDAPPKLQRVLGNSGFVSFSDNRPVRIQGINRGALSNVNSYMAFFQ